VQCSIGFQPVASHQLTLLLGSANSGSHRPRKERGPTVVDARYRLEAYATLLFGLMREVWKTFCRHHRATAFLVSPLPELCITITELSNAGQFAIRQSSVFCFFGLGRIAFPPIIP
jgi:hypothetical protein